MEQYLKHVGEHQCLPTRTDPEIPATPPGHPPPALHRTGLGHATDPNFRTADGAVGPFKKNLRVSLATLQRLGHVPIERQNRSKEIENEDQDERKSWCSRRQPQ